MPSILQLAAATTVALHLIAAVVIDAIGVVGKEPPRLPPLRVSVVDLDLKRMRPPPPEPPPEPAPVEPAVVAEVAREQPKQSERQRVATRTQPPPSERRPNEPPPDTTKPSGGGDPLYRLPDASEGGKGPEIGRGQRPTGPTGDGGAGGGSGGGSGGGEGSGSGGPRPTSIVSIKTKARPRGNFDYFDAGKNYPADARRLGVEGIVKAKLVVDATGKVTKVTLVTKLGHGLDQLATTRGFALEFDPARNADDRPVTSVVVWEFTFTLPK